ncbi:hypothetical protein BIV57_08045 [Mangrovactinospora gilvigrisea]|uniref:M23ase beta-sheet core domain-containing protein n=1 Tax=Mangrovactinospora gilvigrisea TaxID=1428644 RepID=A0A1J7BX16_9ACTN|nr:M23 family metallopeptidase [Mangrovactinospora gilvigrisea]OIV38017.1 hypothetical protein BIV57_08045 [Mangrovactinospora gilvigrisea]
MAALPRVLAAALLVLGPALPAHASTADDSSDAAATATVQTLYRQAATAAEAVRTATAAATTQRRTTARLATAEAGERRRQAGIRLVVGRLARAQYREPVLPPAVQLLLSRDPAGYLDAVSDAHSAETGVAATLDALDASRARLARDRRDSAAAQQALAATAARRTALLADVNRRLDAARALLARLQAAQRAAVRKALGGSAAEGEGQGGSCPPGVSTVPHPEDLAGEHPGRAAAPWIAPVTRYSLSAGFNQAGSHWAHRHSGQDFAVPTGTPVHAAGTGTVIVSGCGGAYGLNVVIKHPGGWYTQYGHLSRLQVRPGEQVVTGQQIGLSGSTGNSTGPHLHFEVRVTPVYGSEVEPLSWLREHGVHV